MKRLWIITLFPEFFGPLVSCGVIGQALSGKRGEGFDLHLVNLRDFTLDKYKSVDDYPAGGGGGLIMRPDILSRALQEGVVKAGGYPENFKAHLHVVFPSPRGKVWQNTFCREFSRKLYKDFSKDLVFICGRYEGVDERFIEKYVDEQISVGDYILSGGEVAVMAILDSALRFCHGVVGNETGPEKESFSDGLLEHPQYTLPREFEGVKIPDILYSGHHANIEKWRLEKALDLTRTNRPDLFERYCEGHKN
jgi:tRNA (guanine37-N1)-methyltransferase